MVALVFGCVALGAAPVGADAQVNASDSLWLFWTATGDDADAGQAYRYDLRYSTSIVGSNIAAWWNAAQSATRVPLPSPSGQTDSASVAGLAPETTYQFVVRVVDEASNASAFSNVASGTTGPETSPPPPGCQAPSSAPAQFQAAEDSGAVAIAWAPTSDPLATEFHIWRGTGASGALSLLTVITDSGQTTYRDISVSAGTAYRYRATWAATCGDGPATRSVLVTLPSSQPLASEPPSGATVHAYPNPSTGPVQIVIDVAASSSQSVRIRLFDLAGHWVTDLADGNFPPGSMTVTWPRTTRNGDRVAPGYYEAIGFVGDTKVREKLILLP